MLMKNSNDTIGNRTRDLPSCSAVPQPIAPPRTLTNNGSCSNTKNVSTLCKLLCERFAHVKLKERHTKSVLSVWVVINDSYKL